MPPLLAIDWHDFFVPSVALAEIILRGSLIYLGIFALMRFVLKREAGTISLPDLLMTVLITIVFWNYALDWLGQRFPRIERLLHPPPLPLVKDGRLLRRNMRRELITEEELWSHLRQQGIAEFAQVQAAYMEGDGQISISPHEDHVK